MARHTVYMRTDLAGLLAETLRHNGLGKLDIWPAGTMGNCVAALTERQVRHFETLAAENDGYISDCGIMWVDGMGHDVRAVHSAR